MEIRQKAGSVSAQAAPQAAPQAAAPASTPAVSSPISLRILSPGAGALLTMPEQSMYGFPLSGLAWSADRISFSIETGSDVSSLKFNGFLARLQPGVDPKIVGSFRGEELEGSFSLALVQEKSGEGETRLIIETGMGGIPGSLLVPPDATSPHPLVVLVAASGATDRDGNNYNVPGRNDAYRLLAESLMRAGIASFRYDKRGSGEAYRLVHDESFLRFYQYVNDAAEVILRFRGDERFSRIVVLGHAEGALVGAAALNRLGEEGDFVDGMILACASSISPLEEVEESLSGTPPELAGEAANIMRALTEGREYPSPTEYFADFFRPSFQAYLSSWFRYGLEAELPALGLPVVIVHGGRDLQASPNDPEGLLLLRPSAAVYVIPGMNRALKEVPDDREKNYDSFTDPSYPLGTGFVELVSAFAFVRQIPTSIIRYRPGPKP